MPALVHSRRDLGDMQWLPQWGNAATAPAPQETPAATANNFASMEKLPRFDRIRGKCLPRQAIQGKLPN